MKSLRSLLFLLACAGWTHADPSQNELENAFDLNFTPCDSLYNHVCNFNSSVFRRFHGPQLLNEIVQLLPADDDVVVRRITQTLRKIRISRNESLPLDALDPRLQHCRYHKLKTSSAETTQSLYAQGKVIGELAAYGRADPFFIACDSKYLCTLLEDTFMEKSDRLLYSEVGHLIKGVFDAYFKALNITIEHDFTIEYPMREDLFAMLTRNREQRLQNLINEISGIEVERMSVEHRHELLSRDGNFDDWFPYLNVLYAQMIYAHPEKFHPEMIDEFDRLVTKILDEICAAIESSDWMRPKSRHRLSRKVRRLKIEIAIPKHLRDLKHLTELLEVYRRAIANVPDTDERGCEYEMLVRAISVSRHRLIYLRKENGTIDFHGWGLNALKFELHIFAQKNGYQSNDRVFIWPTIIYPLYGNYSLGFKYGLVGSTIAHEIFHFLGLDEEFLPHIARIAETPHYSEMRECYYDYYGRITCADDGKECPDGKKKAHEGYCDVEGNRIAYRVLMKALNQSSYRNRAKRNSEIDEFPLFGSKPILSSKADGPDGRLLKDSDLQVDLNEERKSYFYGWQHNMCTEPLYSGEQNMAQAMFHSVHPRPHIRVQIAVKQLKEFSEVFQCKKGDRHFALPDNEICQLYLQVVTSTTATPSITFSLSSRSEKEGSLSSLPAAASHFSEKPLSNFEDMNQPKVAVLAAQFLSCMLSIAVILWV